MSVPQIHTDDLGYEACLDHGIVALGNGVTNVALSYLSRAVELRPTRFALIQLAKAHRDLGQIQAARVCLEQARALPDGHSDSYVLVSLAAILCDLRDYGMAMEVAKEAVKVDPNNPAALKVAERCLREPAQALAKSSEIDPQAIAQVQGHADDLGRKAAEKDPQSAADFLERRRERATQGWLVTSGNPSSQVSVEQRPAVLQQDERDVAKEVEERCLSSKESAASSHPQGSWWWLGWQRIRSLFRN
jgi:tetratricopeptide (TPR) repeat protein